MTIRQLIEKLKNEKNNGVYEVIRYHHERYMTRGHEMEDFDFLSGIFWGLYAGGYISEQERDELMDELLNS